MSEVTIIEENQVIEINEDVVRVVTVGIQGPAGSGDKTYRHVQMSASSTWTIVHSLGKYPSVMVVDSAGEVVIGNIQYTNTSALVVTFSAAFAGEGYCN